MTAHKDIKAAKGGLASTTRAVTPNAVPLPQNRTLAIGNAQYEIIYERKAANSIIYDAVSIETGQSAIIKELDWAAMIKEPKAFALAKREASLLLSLNHPNVPKCLGMDETQGGSIVRMAFEKVDGKTIAQAIKEETRFIDEKAKGVAAGVLDTLEYLHSLSPLPVIHRDISPDNVMLKNSGGIALIDFGFSRSMNSTGTTYFAINSIGFTAPEITQGLEGSVRSDLFSVGALYLYLRTGKTALELMDMGTLELKFPEGLGLTELERLFFAKALANRPNERFSSAKEMKNALYAMEKAALILANKAGKAGRALDSKESEAVFGDPDEAGSVAEYLRAVRGLDTENAEKRPALARQNTQQEIGSVDEESEEALRKRDYAPSGRALIGTIGAVTVGGLLAAEVGKAVGIAAGAAIFVASFWSPLKEMARDVIAYRKQKKLEEAEAKKLAGKPFSDKIEG